jgi:hypothetical protein
VANGIEIEGVAECLAAFKTLDTELRKNASGQLRAASKNIAGQLIPLLGGSGAPQERAILAAAGPKSDRYVVVAVPSKKPKLSGVRRTPADQAKRLAFALEGGSLEPQFRSPAKGSLVAKNIDSIRRMAVPQYEDALVGIMREAGLI